MHKAAQRRTWRKLHLVVDSLSQEMLDHQFTPSQVHDITSLLTVLPRLPQMINRLWADGAYDGEPVYEALYKRRIHPTILPPRNAIHSCCYRL